MPESTSLVNIGDLAKPATVLIERASDAVGGYLKPWQIRRVAQAEADAEIIHALAEATITEIHQRTAQRLLWEETNKQINMESTLAKALLLVEDTARPEDIEVDWMTNFFDKCRLISDDEMQNLWAKVLAGEANSPGAYSRRTVNFLSTVDKMDALLFQNLCRFFGNVEGQQLAVFLYSYREKIYNDYGIDFDALKHLSEIGLLSFDDTARYYLDKLPNVLRIEYFGTIIDVEFPNKADNRLEVGQVLFSKIGQELAPISGAQPVPEFIEYVLNNWGLRQRLVLSCPLL